MKIEVSGNEDRTYSKNRRITLLVDGVERTVEAWITDMDDSDYEFVSAHDLEWFRALNEDDEQDFADAVWEAFDATIPVMTKETHAHLVSLLEFYRESSSGKEEENAKANESAWDEVNKLAGISE